MQPLLFPLFGGSAATILSLLYPKILPAPEKEERKKMATLGGIDHHFRGPGRQKLWRKGKRSGEATGKCSEGKTIPFSKGWRSLRRPQSSAHQRMQPMSRCVLLFSKTGVGCSWVQRKLFWDEVPEVRSWSWKKHRFCAMFVVTKPDMLEEIGISMGLTKKDAYCDTRKKPDPFSETSAMFVGTDKCKVSTHLRFAGTFLTLLTTRSIIDVKITPQVRDKIRVFCTPLMSSLPKRKH